MRTIAPSTTRLALSTSIPKSACPGVSIKLKVHCFHFTGILADWIVIPLSRSAGRKSVVVLPVSTEPEDAKYLDVYRMDSVRVVFPESGIVLLKGFIFGSKMCTDQCGQPRLYSVSWTDHRRCDSLDDWIFSLNK